MIPFSVSGAELHRELSDEGGQAVVQLHGLISSPARDHLLGLDLGQGLSGTRLLRETLAAAEPLPEGRLTPRPR